MKVKVLAAVFGLLAALGGVGLISAGLSRVQVLKNTELATSPLGTIALGIVVGGLGVAIIIASLAKNP